MADTSQMNILIHDNVVPWNKTSWDARRRIHRGPASFLGNWEEERLTYDIDAFCRGESKKFLSRNISEHSHAFVSLAFSHSLGFCPSIFQLLRHVSIARLPRQWYCVNSSDVPWDSSGRSSFPHIFILLRLDSKWGRSARWWSLMAGYMKWKKAERD